MSGIVGSQNAVEINAYGEHVRDFMSPKTLVRLLVMINHIHMKLYAKDKAYFMVRKGKRLHTRTGVHTHALT